MKKLESKIFDIINNTIVELQNRLLFLRNNSMLLANIDFLILLSVVFTYVISAFATTNQIAVISFLVPFLVVIKVLTTKGEKIELERCNFYLLIYLFICFISNFTSSMPAQSIYGFIKTLMYFGFYFGLCQFLKNNKQYIMILLFVIASVISFEGVIGLIQNSIGVDNISTWQDTSYLNPEDVLSRVYGTLKPYNPNLLAGFMIVGLPSIIGLLGIYFNNKKFKSAIIACIFLCVSVLTIFLTGCRGAYLALFSIIVGVILASANLVFYFYNNAGIKKLWKILMTFFAACSVAFMLLNQSILKRLMSIFILRGDSSTSFRMNVYQSSWQMFQDNWFFGIGVGNKVFREIYGLYMLSGFDALSCYCIFLEMAVESGILSLIAYLLFVFSLLKSGIQKFAESNNLNYKILIFISSISIIAVMVHGLFDTIYFRPQVQYIFWTMAAILITLVRSEKQ